MAHLVEQDVDVLRTTTWTWPLRLALDGYDYDTLADDLGALLEQLDLWDVTLVAHSMGGGEIVRYLTRHGAIVPGDRSRLGDCTVPDEDDRQPTRD